MQGHGRGYRTGMKIAGLVAAMLFIGRGFMERNGWLYFGIGAAILLAVIARQLLIRD